jgi:hypothetical protein
VRVSSAPEQMYSLLSPWQFSRPSVIQETLWPINHRTHHRERHIASSVAKAEDHQDMILFKETFWYLSGIIDIHGLQSVSALAYLQARKTNLRDHCDPLSGEEGRSRLQRFSACWVWDRWTSLFQLFISYICQASLIYKQEEISLL